MRQIRLHWMHRLTAFFAILLLPLYGSAAYYAWRLPDSYYVNTGSTLEIDTRLQIKAQPTVSTVQAAANGVRTQTETLRLFGIISIKTVEVEEIETPVLIPCGQPFGLKLQMGGAMVVGMGDVETASGGCCPAQEAGIQVGDFIQSIDGVEITSNQALQAVITASEGETLEIIRRRSLRMPF
ncbi:MAG: PDZ domain-containing protein [Ruminococcus sp.]|nr:PDZ domain-containing protein [Ruminococcus sp.]